MRLRGSPASREFKVKVRAKKKLISFESHAVISR
jgi:hypothetical protein